MYNTFVAWEYEIERERKGSKRTLTDPRCAGILSVSSPLPSPASSVSHPPPLHLHPLPWPEFRDPRPFAHPRIWHLIDRLGVVERREAPVLLPETVFFFPCWFLPFLTALFPPIVGTLLVVRFGVGVWIFLVGILGLGIPGVDARFLCYYRNCLGLRLPVGLFRCRFLVSWPEPR